MLATAIDLRTILVAAGQAPSSHNTQPWLFQPSGLGVRLFADRRRGLPANDPHDRELTISCGCALLNLRAAAAAAGLEARVQILPDEGDADLLAVIEFAADCPPFELAALAAEIPRRRTCRQRFENRNVPETVLHDLAAAAEQEQASLAAIAGGGIREAVAHLVSHGDAVQWSDASWRRELAQWMHPRRSGDGLTVPGLVAPIAQAVVRTFDMGNGVAARDSQLTEHSPVLALLGTERDDAAAWLQAGQALQRVLLLACSHGLQASYLNQPIQVAALRPELQRLAGAHHTPQILLRLGYPDAAVAPAPRRPVDDIIEA